MSFLYSDLGQLDRGDRVTVNIQGDSVNVRLMDASNYERMCSGREYRYHGGHATSSPVIMSVPSGGHWYVVLDRGGHAFSVRWGASFQRRR